MINSSNSEGPELFSDKSNKELFNTYAKSYTDDINHAVSFSFQDADFFAEAKADYLLSLISKKMGNASGLKLLDIGCGTGILHKFLVRSGLNVSGVDISANSLEIANFNNPNVKYSKFDGEILPFGNNSFDITIAICVFHHIPVNERVALAKEMSRVTRYGGLFCIIEHNPFNPLTRLAVW